jgi:hypothetical protein
LLQLVWLVWPLLGLLSKRNGTRRNTIPKTMSAAVAPVVIPTIARMRGSADTPRKIERKRDETTSRLLQRLIRTRSIVDASLRNRLSWLVKGMFR